MVCPVCDRSVAVTSTGSIQVHGSVHRRCRGSSQLPSSLARSCDSTGASTLSPGSPHGDLSSTTASSNSCTGLFSDFSHPLPRFRVVKRIPKGSREIVCQKLTAILNCVVATNTISSWKTLFSFAPVCLGLPSRGGQRRSLVSHINKQAEQESLDLVFESSHSARRSPRSNKESL